MTVEAQQETKRSGWFLGLIDGAARALDFGSSKATPKTTVKSEGVSQRVQVKRGSGDADLRKRSAEVHRLAGEGMPHLEIARRTALSHDTVALLLHLAPQEPVETAARGTFFRILQTRMAS